jgi:DNA repair exonuclease SbcCD ATPase subunit
LKLDDTKYSELIISNDSKINIYKEQIKLLNIDLDKLNKIISVKNNDIITIKTKYNLLGQEYKEYKDVDNSIVLELKQKGSLLNIDKKDKKERIQYLHDDNKSLIELSKLLDDDGVRKNIIASLVKPINEILSGLLNKINYPYIVKLNDEFDAEIYDRGNLTNSEMLSNGETRMLNICIAISYIIMINSMNSNNIIFMDEVFQSVDLDNIDKLLVILKEFAVEHKIHLILMHPGSTEVLDYKNFNRVIKVNKNVFATLEILDL